MQFDECSHVMIVAAHPDDETIGAGALMGRLGRVTVVHTTDGSPRDLSDARRAGLRSRQDYARVRREELERALRVAGVDPANAVCLGFTDQETMLNLPELCGRVREEIARWRPDVIVTQPYEGGHPDHDSTAFAVQMAADGSVPVFEMTSYHAGACGGLETGVFLGNGEAPVVCGLSAEDGVRKARMLECFRTQREVLSQFAVVAEQFRRAPIYDFATSPHSGTLHYERLPWGITGERWRQLAAQCL